MICAEEGKTFENCITMLFFWMDFNSVILCRMVNSLLKFYFVAVLGLTERFLDKTGVGFPHLFEWFWRRRRTSGYSADEKYLWRRLWVSRHVSCVLMARCCHSSHATFQLLVDHTASVVCRMVFFTVSTYLLVGIFPVIEAVCGFVVVSASYTDWSKCAVCPGASILLAIFTFLQGSAVWLQVDLNEWLRLFAFVFDVFAEIPCS